jgi:hypothetical protein
LSGYRGFRRPDAPRPAYIGRLAAVRKLSNHLQRFGWPRLEMSLIVAATGVSGFFASLLLLAMGVEQMWQRYPLAVGVAYVVFLLELWAWMHLRGEYDGPDVDIYLDHNVAGNAHDTLLGHGGDFGGGGATGSFDAPEPTDAIADSFSTVGDVADVGGAADGEGCAIVIVLLVVVALVGGLLLTAVYLVYGAPVLLAELLVDGALSYGLYRKLRQQDRGFWLVTAVRRTGKVFLLTAAFLSAAGAALAWHHPGAHSLGEVMEYKAVEPEAR